MWTAKQHMDVEEADSHVSPFFIQSVAGIYVRVCCAVCDTVPVCSTGWNRTVSTDHISRGPLTM